jgi:hypothetical protein
MRLTNRTTRPDAVPLSDLPVGAAFITGGRALYIKGEPWRSERNDGAPLVSSVYAMKFIDGQQRVETVSFNRDYRVRLVRLDEFTFTEIDAS